MKVDMKYIIDGETLEATFECEKANDIARGMYNVVNGGNFEDIATEDAAMDLFRDPSYYREGGKPGELVSYASVLANKFDNLVYVAFDGAVAFKK